MEIPKIEELSPSALRESALLNAYPEFCEYVLSKYYGYSLREAIYLYINNMNIAPECPVCGKPLKFNGINKGYTSHCSKECANADKNTGIKKSNTLKSHYGDKWGEFMKSKIQEKYGVDNVYQLDSIKEKIKSTNLEKYGVTHLMKKEGEYERRSIKIKETNMKRYNFSHAMKSPECKDKMKSTNLEKYGVICPLQNEEIDKKTRQTNLEKYGNERFTRTQDFLDKQAKTCLEKYGYTSYTQTDDCKEKAKKTCLEKYGTVNYCKSDEYKFRHDEIQDKIYQSKKEHHTFNSSKIEEQLKQYLDENNIEYKYQYKSNEYPFSCDFYFPTKKLYLEIQGNWTHGNHPFDSNNIDDIKQVEYWKSKNTKYYNNAIENWTIRDVKKREIAKKNNLNYIEYFGTDIYECIMLITENL